MKRFFKNLSLLTIPLVVYLISVVVIDPFNYLNVSNVVDDRVKYNISCEVAPHMYKLLDFKNNPRENILLGDSRTNVLSHCMDSTRWANLAYGGGTIKEIVQSYWRATELTQLDTVLIGLDLNLYNKYNKRFYVEEALESQKNFFSFAFNRNVFRSNLLILKNLAAKKEVSINEVTASKEEFWEYQLTVTCDKFYKKIAYPENYFLDLKAIAEDCKKNKTVLKFWIPPTHTDFQASLEKYNIEEARQRFIDDLLSLGEVYDYNYANNYTMDTSKFRDPLHFTLEMGNSIRRELFEGETFMARHLYAGME